jgi:hypothetical protein
MLLPTGLVVLTLLIAMVALIVHLKHRADGRTKLR